MNFDSVYGFPRVYELYYPNAEAWVEALYTIDANVKTLFLNKPNYHCKLNSYMTSSGGFLIELRIDRKVTNE